MKKTLFFLLAIFLSTLSWQVKAQYCTPEGTNPGRYIDEFSTSNGLQNVSNLGSSFSNGGYGDFTAMTAQQEIDGAIDFNVSIEGGTAGFRIWVDWDQNGTFDTAEVAYQSSAYSATHSGTITVPSNALSGDTRMRVVSHWFSSSGDVDPCETGFTNGEFEDYTVNVIIPSCPRPSVLTVDAVAVTTADISWTAGDSETAWNIKYSDTPGFDPTSEGMSASASGSPSTQLTGLAANTNYEFYVQADCGSGDESTWEGPASFTTACAAVAAFPYEQGFEGVTTPDLSNCWTQNDVNDDGDSWRTYTAYGVDSSIAAGLHTDFNNGDNDDYLISPQFVLTGNERVRFSARVRSSSEPDEFRVVLSTTDLNPASFTEELLPATTISSTEYQEFTINLDAYTGNVYIAVHVPPSSTDGYYFYVDNFIVEPIPSCPRPSVLTVDAVAATTADISWTAGDSETAWNIKYSDTPGFDPTSEGMSASANGSPSTQLTGLAANTDYEFYVQADCGSGDESTWEGPISFATTCESISDFYQDFEGATGTSLPDCWSKVGEIGSTDTRSSTKLSGARVLYAYDDVTIALPVVDNAAAGTHQMVMDVVGNFTSGGTIELGYLTNVTDASSFTSISSIETNSDTDSQEFVTIPSGMPVGDVVFAIHAPGTTSSLIDNVRWEPIPSCPRPSVLTVGAVAATTADISWTAGNTETAWNIKYSDTPGFDPTSEGMSAGASGSPSTQLTGLAANTDYEFYVQADCGSGDESIWEGPMTFTTQLVAAPTWEEEFLMTSTPEGWSTTGWIIGTSRGVTGNPGNNIYKNLYGTGSNSSGVFTTINVGPVASEQVLSFDYKASLYSSPYGPIGENSGSFTISISTDYGQNYNEVVSVILPNDNAWQSQSYPLTDYIGDVITIKIEATRDAEDFDLAFDNFFVGTPPTCPAPTALTAEDVTTETVDVSWTAGDSETAWNIKYSDTPDFDPTSEGMSASASGSPSAQLTSLTSGTAYEIYVQADCGSGDESTWVGPLMVNTLIVNDNLCDALPLTVGASSAGDAYTNEGTTAQTDEPNGSCWSGTTSPKTVWFSFVAPASGNVTATTDINGGTLDDTHIAIYEAATDCSDLSTLGIEVGCDEDGGGAVGHNWRSIATMTGLTSGETYYVQVDGYSSNTGTFGLEVHDDGYVYVDDTDGWLPMNPVGNATPSDNITVMNGATSLTSDLEVNDVTVMSGATLKVESVLTVNGNMTNNGDFVFMSNASGNGELAEIPASSTITGDFTVERWMSAKRSYRMVSSSVTTTSSIHDNWQEGASGSTDDPNPGYGTHITGSVSGSNGFDATPTGNPSLFTVNAATQAFDAVANTTDALVAGQGYLLYVRGSRAVDLTAVPVSSADETVLRATGELHVGTYTQSTNLSEVQGEFNMLANPYQSTVDVNAVIADSQNLNGNFAHFYDPNLGTYGGYVTVELPAGTNSSGSQANQYLQPGQAVQVATASDGPTSVIFNESAKAPGNHNSTFSQENMSEKFIVGQLFTAERYANDESLHDSFKISFDASYSNALDNFDAVKPLNFTENMGIGSVESAYSIERRTLPEEGEELSLFINNHEHDNYMLRFDVNELDGVEVYLNDNYTGEAELLEAGENLYAFSVNESSSESLSSNRFSLSFEQVTLGLDQPETDFGIKLYPNPTEIGNAFYITTGEFKGKDVEVRMIDMFGKTVYESKLMFKDTRVKIQPEAALSSGVYMISIINNDKKVEKRLIIL